MCIYMYIYICVCACVYIYICMCMYTGGSHDESHNTDQNDEEVEQVAILQDIDTF